MDAPTPDTTIALLRLLAFLFSVLASLIAGQLYLLARSTSFGRVWRPFLVGALLFVAWSMAQFANTFFGSVFGEGDHAGIVMDLLVLLGVMHFAMGFYETRQAYFRKSDEGFEEGVDDYDAFGRPVARDQALAPEQVPEQAQAPESTEE